MGIRNHRYKLMFLYADRLNATGSQKESKTPSWEFFDLMTDPQENKNLYGSPSYSHIIDEMKKEMIMQRRYVGDTDKETPRMAEIMNQYYW